jgi:hypothetical protein
MLTRFIGGSCSGGLRRDYTGSGIFSLIWSDCLNTVSIDYLVEGLGSFQRKCFS